MTELGLKVTFTVHVAFAARLAGQLFVCAKSPGNPPVTAMLLMLSAPVPVFFRTEDFGALVAFTGTFGNARLWE